MQLPSEETDMSPDTPSSQFGQWPRSRTLLHTDQPTSNQPAGTLNHQKAQSIFDKNFGGQRESGKLVQARVLKHARRWLQR